MTCTKCQASEQCVCVYVCLAAVFPAEAPLSLPLHNSTGRKRCELSKMNCRSGVESQKMSGTEI